jgi:hypothetical protein|eukprot:COSAG01_NODE_3456_length_6073_cov_96.792769_2_plen_127_part_00
MLGPPTEHRVPQALRHAGGDDAFNLDELPGENEEKRVVDARDKLRRVVIHADWPRPSAARPPKEAPPPPPRPRTPHVISAGRWGFVKGTLVAYTGARAQAISAVPATVRAANKTAAAGLAGGPLPL